MKKFNVLALSLLASMTMAGCNLGGTSSSSSNNKNSTTNSSPKTSDVVSSSSSKQDKESSTSTSTGPKEVALTAGDAAAAVANPGQFYYTADADATVDGKYLDGVNTIDIDGMTTQESVVLFYEAPAIVTGNRYEVELDVHSTALMNKLTINGVVYELAKGDNKINFRFTESSDPTLTIVVGDATKNGEGEYVDEFVVEKVTLTIKTPLVTDVVYNSLDTVTLDGDLSEWTGTKNEENTVGIYGSGDYEGKGATFYATLTEGGVYIAADVHHAKYINDGGAWWQSSNLEFFIGADARQGWVSAKASDDKKLVTEYEWTLTGDETTGYHSVIEAYIPLSNIAENSVVLGEIRVGFAWKTIGDKCNNGEANGGGADEYWVPKGTWTNNADMTYVTKDGIFRKSTVSFELDDFKTVKLDGKLDDWAEINGVTLTGDGDTAHKNVTWYARLTSEGLFVAAEANHDVYINDSSVLWWQNTNLEFWVNGGNQKYISAKGECAGGVYGTHTSVENETGAVYHTVFEGVIPSVYLEGLQGNAENVTINFAFKTIGDMLTGGADPVSPSDWWIVKAGPQNAANQYVVTETGLVIE